MPSPILHLTHGMLLTQDRAIPAPLREAMAAELPHTRLGSIFPDLPFYTNIVPMTLGYWLERPAENCPIAGRMHSDHPDRFAWHFLRRCREHRAEALTERQRLALLGGFFSHVALDLEVHPLVNWCARKDVIRYGGHESHHHRLAEKYHSLFFHVDLEGRDCLGQRQFFTRRARVVDGPAFFRLRDDLPVVNWTAETLAFYREHAPSPRQVARWIRTFRHFSFLVSIPAARRNSARLGNPENRRRYYDNESFRFVDFWDRGYRRSIEMLRLAYDYYRAGDFSPESQADFLAAANISDLAYPPERNLQPLPVDGVGDLELVAV